MDDYSRCSLTLRCEERPIFGASREAIMRERLSARMAVGAMVDAAITASALQLVFSLADQRETKHLALTLTITQAKTSIDTQLSKP